MTDKNITSLANPRIKRVVGLRDHKERAKSGATIVEGAREIDQALLANIKFEELYICRDLLGDYKVNEISDAVAVYETTKAVFSKIAYGERAEGILAVCAPKAVSFDDLKVKKDTLLVVVERVEKPGNLGAILRTCDGAGVDGVIVCDGKTDIYNPNVIRASLGTVFSNKVVVGTNNEAIDFLKANNVQVCAASPNSDTLYTRPEFKGSLALVVGSEQDGLSEFWESHADLKVRIPMNGRADSLNVSASTAVLLYEIIRQRGVA